MLEMNSPVSEEFGFPFFKDDSASASVAAWRHIMFFEWRCRSKDAVFWTNFQTYWNFMKFCRMIYWFIIRTCAWQSVFRSKQLKCRYLLSSYLALKLDWSALHIRTISEKQPLKMLVYKFMKRNMSFTCRPEGAFSGIGNSKWVENMSRTIFYIVVLLYRGEWEGVFEARVPGGRFRFRTVLCEIILHM